MTAFDSSQWGRKATIILPGDQIVGGPHQNCVQFITAAMLLASNPEMLTLGDPLAMQSDCGDARASSDAAGVSQIPLYAYPEITSLAADPADSQVLFAVQVGERSAGVDKEITLHWLPTSAVTPEDAAGAFGEHAVFRDRYNGIWAFQEDPELAVFRDSSGRQPSVNRTGLTRRAGQLGREQVWPSTTNTTVTFGTLIDSALPVGIALLNSSPNLSEMDLRGATENLYNRLQAASTFSVANGTGTAGFNGSWTAATAVVLSDGTLITYAEGELGPLVSAAASYSEDFDRLIIRGRVGDSTSWHRIYRGPFDADWPKTEHKFFTTPEAMAIVQAGTASAADATLVLAHCPAGGRFAAFRAASDGGAVSEAFGQVHPTTAGSNSVTATVTGSQWLFVSFIPADFYRPVQLYFQLPSTGGAIDLAPSLATDTTHRTADETLTDGDEFALVPGDDEVVLTEPVNGRSLYSSIVKAFRVSATLCASWFPLFAVERAWLRMMHEWALANAENLQGAGFDVVAGGPESTVAESHVGNRSLGDLTGCTVYYSLAGGAAVALAPGAIDTPTKVFDALGADSRAADMTLFARRWGYRYSLSSVLGVGGSLAEPAAFAHALDTSTPDPEIVATVAAVDADAPYTGITETPGATTEDVGGTSYPFTLVIDCNGATTAQLHTWDARQMLFDGADNLRLDYRGSFDGDTFVTAQGVYLTNVVGAVIYTDADGVERAPPASVLFSVRCVDQSGAPIEGARVRVEAGATGPLTQGDVIVNALTDSTGTASTSVVLSGTQSLQNGWARKASASPMYREAPVQGEITESGFSTTVTMVLDE